MGFQVIMLERQRKCLLKLLTDTLFLDTNDLDVGMVKAVRENNPEATRNVSMP